MSKNHIIVDGIKYIKESFHHSELKKATEKVSLKKTTVVDFILDRSGSMSNVWMPTIDGFNEYIEGLKDDGNDYRVSLTLFDTEIEHPFKDKSIQDVPRLTQEVYYPRGGTALYDAVCSTVEKAHRHDSSNTKHLVVIMTDGYENSSHEYHERDMKRIKDQYTAEGNWTFVFLGSNQDAWATASRWGYSQMNTATYNSTTRGMGATFSAMAVSTSNFAGSDAFSTGDFMSQEQQEKIKMEK